MTRTYVHPLVRMAFSTRNSVQQFRESDSRIRRWRPRRRGWKRAKGADRPRTVSIFVRSVYRRRVPEKGRAGWAEGAEVESDKWTGFNLRPINILVLSSRSLSCPVCLPFRRSPAVFSFFSRICYLCRALGNILSTVGLASRIFLLFYDS